MSYFISAFTYLTGLSARSNVFGGYSETSINEIPELFLNERKTPNNEYILTATYRGEPIFYKAVHRKDYKLYNLYTFIRPLVEKVKEIQQSRQANRFSKKIWAQIEENFPEALEVDLLDIRDKVKEEFGDYISRQTLVEIIKANGYTSDEFLAMRRKIMSHPDKFNVDEVFDWIIDNPPGSIGEVRHYSKEIIAKQPPIPTNNPYVFKTDKNTYFVIDPKTLDVLKEFKTYEEAVSFINPKRFTKGNFIKYFDLSPKVILQNTNWINFFLRYEISGSHKMDEEGNLTDEPTDKIIFFNKVKELLGPETTRDLITVLNFEPRKDFYEYYAEQIPNSVKAISPDTWKRIKEIGISLTEHKKDILEEGEQKLQPLIDRVIGPAEKENERNITKDYETVNDLERTFIKEESNKFSKKIIGNNTDIFWQDGEEEDEDFRQQAKDQFGTHMPQNIARKILKEHGFSMKNFLWDTQGPQLGEIMIRHSHPIEIDSLFDWMGY